MSRPKRATVAAALTCATALMLGACDDGTTPSADKPSTTEQSDSPTEPATPDPTSGASTPDETTDITPTAQPPETTPPTDNSTAKRARKAQIRSADFPGFNAEWSWDSSERHRGPGRSERSNCLHTDLVAIGGVSEYSTTLMNSSDSTAVAYQLTAVFPDGHTAMTAESVLTTWQTKCQTYSTSDRQLKHVDVSEVRDVPTAVGTGRQWTVTYRPVPHDPDAVWFSAEGFVRDGDVITYLVIRNAGQDYNYELGHEPMDMAVAVAGDYLKRTR